MAKGKKKTNNGAHPEFLKLVDVAKRLQNEKLIGVSFQMRLPDGGVLVFSSMKTPDCLGALEIAKIVSVGGAHAHQSLDSFVQAVEARPELLDRIIESIDARLRERFQ